MKNYISTAVATDRRIDDSPRVAGHKQNTNNCRNLARAQIGNENWKNNLKITISHFGRNERTD